MVNLLPPPELLLVEDGLDCGVLPDHALGPDGGSGDGALCCWLLLMFCGDEDDKEDLPDLRSDCCMKRKLNTLYQRSETLRGSKSARLT